MRCAPLILASALLCGCGGGTADVGSSHSGAHGSGAHGSDAHGSEAPDAHHGADVNPARPGGAASNDAPLEVGSEKTRVQVEMQRPLPRKPEFLINPLREPPSPDRDPSSDPGSEGR